MTEKIHIVYSEKHKLHRDPIEMHVENPRRVESIVSELKSSDLWGLVNLVEAPSPDYNAVLLAHSLDYVEWLKKECSKGFHYIDADTYVNEYTCDVAASFATASRHAALSALEHGGIWIILARPGGHHAGKSGRAMYAPTLGFCIFDYTSIATLSVLERGAISLALDFDAHHGNGSQEILWSEPRVAHIDVHQWRIYPGSGWVTDIGGRGAEGTKINIPLYRGSGDPEFTWTLEYVVKKVVSVVKPDITVVFAGFDAHVEDPLTGLKATEKTYILYGSYLRELLEKNTIRGVVVILGGGYSRSLVSCFKSFIEGLLGLREPAVVEPRSPGEHVEKALPLVLKNLEETVKSVKSKGFKAVNC